MTDLRRNQNNTKQKTTNPKAKALCKFHKLNLGRSKKESEKISKKPTDSKAKQKETESIKDDQVDPINEAMQKNETAQVQPTAKDEEEKVEAKPRKKKREAPQEKAEPQPVNQDEQPAD